MTPVSANNTLESGFTLVEVLIFVTLLSLMFIAFSAITAVSLTRERTNMHKIMAEHYGEELREWVRGQKEINWEDFAATKMGTWCFNAEPIAAWPGATGSCSSYGLDSLYKREIILSSNAETTQVTAQITTTWQEGATTYTAPLKTVLTVYE